MKNANVLCVRNKATNKLRNRILKYVEKRLKNIQLKNNNRFSFIFCFKQKITFIFLKIRANLSLYRSYICDKNLSLIYIWSHDYINVSMSLVCETARNCPTISKIKQEIVRQFTLVVRQFSANNNQKFTGDLIS